MKNPIAKTLLVGLVGGAHAELRYGTHIPFNRFWLAWGRNTPKSLNPKSQAYCSMDPNGTPPLGGISSGSDFCWTHSLWHWSRLHLPMACACMATRNQITGVENGWSRIFSLISLLGVFYAF